MVLKIKTRGKDGKGAPTICINLSGIIINSTNPQWEVVELQEMHKVNEKGEVIMYKEIYVEKFGMKLELPNNPIQITDSFPIRIRIRTKKEYFRGPIVQFGVVVELLEEFKLSMHQQEFKCLQDVVDSLLECFNREAPKSAPTVEDIKVSSLQPKSESTPSTPTKSLWGRFTGILGSYKNLYQTGEEPQVNERSPSPELEDSKSTESFSDSDDEEFFDSYEDFSELPVEKAITVEDAEDLQYSEYRIRIHKGEFSLYDYLLGERRGIASLTFDELDCQFIPEIYETYESITDYKPKQEDEFLLSQKPIKTSKINISVFQYEAQILDDSPMYHPNYYKLFERKNKNNIKEDQNMLDLKFFRICNPEKTTHLHRELSIHIDSVVIVFDVQIWERIYMFFFEGDKGEKFEQYLTDNIEYIFQEALSDEVHFMITSNEPVIVLPPYAGKFGSRPHLASKVSTLYTTSMKFKSVDREKELPDIFSKSLYKQQMFPADETDIEDVTPESLYTSKRFEIDVSGAQLEIMATPESESMLVLKPFDMSTFIFSNQLKPNVGKKPNLDVYLKLSEIDFSMNQSQYGYLLGIWGERLTWNPHKLSEEKLEALRMEELLKAASEGKDHLSSSEIVIQNQTAAGSFFMRVHLAMDKTRLNFLERKIQDSSSYDVLARMDVPNIDFMFEMHEDKNCMKAILPSFTLKSPQHENSPFSHILSTFDQREDCLLFRMESYYQTPPVPSHFWVKMNAVKIFWIYTTLANFLIFFTGDEIPPEYREEKVKEFIASYRFDQTPSIGMDWDIEFNASDVVIVETPDTPECSPMHILHGSLSRIGVSEKEIKYAFEGNVSFFSNMIQDQIVLRESMTKPFMMNVLYFYAFNDETEMWTTKIDMDIEKIEVIMSRRQLIMMESILDNQMSDIRDVSEKRTSDEDKKKIPTIRMLYNSFKIGAKQMKLSLKDKNKVFSTIHLENFVYGTENWSDNWVMFVEASAILIKSKLEEESRLTKVILRKRNRRRKVLKVKDGHQEEDSAPIGDTKAISIRYDVKQEDFKGKHDESKPWNSRWQIDISPFEFMYNSRIVEKYQDFFALIEEHKNLRKRYQRIQSEISRLYNEQEIDEDTYENALREYQAKEENASNEYSGMALSIKINNPRFFFPENQYGKTSTVLELDFKRVRFGNDINILKRNIDGLSQYELNIKQTRLLLHTLEMEDDDATLENSLIQTHELIHPTTAKIDIYSKIRGANQTPMVHLSLSIDTFKAKISLNRYQMIVGILNQYVSQLLERIDVKPDANAEAIEGMDKLDMNEKVSKKVFIDKLFEMSLKTMKVTIVSDYMDELDLVYLYTHDVQVYGISYKNRTELSVAGRLMMTLSNLNYMKGEEQFIEDLSFMLKLKMDNGEDDLMKPITYEDETLCDDDIIVDLSDEETEILELNNNNTSLSVELVILNKFEIFITKEVIRQLFEIYQIYSTDSLNKESELHSHFQYIVVNNTESDIRIRQIHRNEHLLIQPKQEKHFVFPDPKLPRKIDVEMRHSEAADKLISLEALGTQVLIMTQNDTMVQREIFVSIVSKGLKRYVEFSSSYFVTNETDRVLEVVTLNANSSFKETIGKYIIWPQNKIPIACSENWEVEMQIRFDDEWENRQAFLLERKPGTTEIKFYNIGAGDERTLLMNTSKEVVLDQYEKVNIVFAPPIFLANVSPIPLEYHFTSMYFLNEISVDMEDDFNQFKGTVPAHSDKAFYIDLIKASKISTRLKGYSGWSPSISLLRDQKTLIEILDHSEDQEDDQLLLTVFVDSRLDNLGRTVTINTQYLLVNYTDTPVLLRQHGSKKIYDIHPKQMKPFSWSKGSRQIMVNFGNTAWSGLVSLSNDSFHRIEIEMPNTGTQYMFLMETKSIDDYSRVICFRNWLNIQNSTSSDINLNFAVDEPSDSEFEEFDDIEKSHWITIPKNSSTQYSICPSILEIALANGNWSPTQFCIKEAKKYTLQIFNRDDEEYFAIDIDVKLEENGLFLTFKDNKDPPYVLYNNTPFGLNLKREKIATNEPRSIGKIEPNEYLSYIDTMHTKTHEDIYYIGPHESVSLYTVEQSENDEEYIFQLSVFMVEDAFDNEVNDELESENVKKHRRNKSGVLNLSDDSILKNTKQSSNISTKQIRKNAQFKQFFSEGRSTWSEPFSLVNPQEGTLVRFLDEENPEALNSLHAAFKAQGKTLSLTFSLPDLEAGTIAPQETQNLSINITIPSMHVILEEENRRYPMVAFYFTGFHMEYVKFSSTSQYLYFVCEDIEAETLFNTAEYPVLFIVDKSQLHNYTPNMLELLVEWNERDNRIFTEYVGLRMLPFIIQLDGEVISVLKEFGEMFISTNDDQYELVSTDPTVKNRKVMVNLLKKFTTFQQEQFVQEDEIVDDGLMFAGKLEIFPLAAVISVGTNNHHFPVISEAHLSLDSFVRTNMYASPMNILSSLGSSYATLIWAEVYKIIGNIDAIASPVQNLLKLKKGVQDFFVLPYESLVLDDTPGAFLIGFLRGTKSLLLNLTDFLLTTFMKLSSSLSWIIQVVSLDSDYQEFKINSSRQHPTNILYGIAQGFVELGYSVYSGVSGIIVMPYKGIKAYGSLGLFIGIGKGLIGIPTKPSGGVFDFLSKTFEGILQTIGRGYILQKSKQRALQ